MAKPPEGMGLWIGRVDGFIARRLAFPIIRRIVAPFGNFTLARLFVFGACLGETVWVFLSFRDLFVLVLTVAGNVFIGGLISKAYIGRMERAATNLNDEIVPYELYAAVRLTASIRQVYTAFGFLITLSGILGGNFINAGQMGAFYALMVLGLYAATYIAPRRPIKAVAKVKAYLARPVVPQLARVGV